MSKQDDLNELQQKKDSRPPMIKYGDRPGNTIPNNDMNNNLDNVTVFGDVSADAAQISLDSANDAYESKQSAETLLSLVSGTVGLPPWTVPGAPLAVNSTGTGVVFETRALGGAAFMDSTQSRVDKSPSRLMKPNDFGLGGDYGFPISDFNEQLPWAGFIVGGASTTPNRPPGAFSACGINMQDKSEDYGQQIAAGVNEINIWHRRKNNGIWSNWYKFYCTGNTAVDSNGFIKTASPIVQLYNDRIDKTDDLEIADTQFERVSTGYYILHNTPLLSRNGWYIETPKDRNNNIYFTLDYEEADGDLIIRTYTPNYENGRAENGDPVDILDGRYVSLRFAENPDLYPDVEV